MELTDRDYGVMATIIEDLDSLNPNAAINIKLAGEGFTLYYIAAETVDYKDSPIHRECVENGNKRLDDAVKELKAQFKEETGNTLSFKEISTDETLETMSPALQRHYLRIFRNYELT